MPTLRYKFDDELTVEDRDRIKGVIEEAFRRGEIISCKCAVIEALVYPTLPPDFQASFACSCDAMRPIFSSTPDSDD